MLRWISGGQRDLAQAFPSTAAAYHPEPVLKSPAELISELEILGVCPKSARQECAGNERKRFAIRIAIRLVRCLR
jgi:hypothetical protein